MEKLKDMADRIAIILAAGVSSRMNTRLPKVLHEVCGRPMLAYVLDACRQVGARKIYVVVGFGADQVREKFKDSDDITWVIQNEQKGTAHAVLCCKEYIKDFDGQTLVICGDMPLVRAETLETLIQTHEDCKSATTLATAILDDPAGYGRINRDKYGNLKGIIEHADCSEEQLKIQEINPSYYLFDNKVMLEALDKIEPNNVKNEYYITDALSIVLASGRKALAVTALQPEEAMGVNSRAQLSDVGRIMQNRIQNKLMEDGVTIVDPENTWIDARAKIGLDTIIEPFTYIHGEVSIGIGCRIGPFAFVRTGTNIADDVVLGVFTEVKNTSLASGVRARHHSYIGDAVIGRNVNIGAGSITANFDGEKINKTNIGNECYIGSGTVLIAPLELKDNSIVQSGTVVSQQTVEKIGQKG